MHYNRRCNWTTEHDEGNNWDMTSSQSMNRCGFRDWCSVQTFIFWLTIEGLSWYDYKPPGLLHNQIFLIVDTSRNRNARWIKWTTETHRIAAPLTVYTVARKVVLFQEREHPGPQSSSTSRIVLLHLNELSWKWHAAADCSASVFGLGLALPTGLEKKSLRNWSVKIRLYATARMLLSLWKCNDNCTFRGHQTEH